MALETYDELKAEIADWLNRTDLTVRIPSFIRLAEAQMNRRLDCRQMEQTITLSLADETYPLPCGFAGVKSFRIDGTPSQPLTYVLAPELDTAFGSVGKPWRYTISGESFVFDPAPDTDYAARLRYRKRVPNLSSAVRCNWLLEDHPDAYLYGSLMQAAPYLRDDERIGTWSGLYESALSDIAADDKRQSQPSTLNARGRQL